MEWIRSRIRVLGDQSLDTERKIVLLVHGESRSVQDELHYSRARRRCKKVRRIDVEQVLLVATVDRRELVLHRRKDRRVHVVPVHDSPEERRDLLQQLILPSRRYFQSLHLFHGHSELQDFGIPAQNLTRRRDFDEVQAIYGLVAFVLQMQSFHF